MITLLVVDDQLSVRRGLQMRLSIESDMSVIGEAADATTGLELACQLRPDVVLMDVELPDLDGISATASLRCCAPEISVVVLSLHDDADTRARARAAGAFAFVAKQDPDAALLAAIRRAADR